MKSNHPVITLLGSNSGNNVGDAAILAAALDVLSQELPGAEFLVPTTKPEFVNQNYGKRYNVTGVNIMPWTGSLRFLGLPTLNCLRRSDAALICDGIIFGKKLYNPGFNMLVTLAPLVPFAKLFGCKLVCYSTGIGPFPEGQGRGLARYLIQNCDLIMMRERDSLALTKEIGVTRPVELTGDAAFINQVSSSERAQEIAAIENLKSDRPFFGINVTSYLDAWLEKQNQLSDRGAFIRLIADAVSQASAQLQGAFTPLVFSTHPMDLEPARELAKLLSTSVISNSVYLSHDMQAMMQRCELFMGMRFHSVVLASAVYTPVIALIYAPKVRGYMRLLDCERYGMEFAGLNAPKLAHTICQAWQERAQLKQQQTIVVDQLKQGAFRAATLVRERVYPEFGKKLDTAEVEKRSVVGVSA